MCCFLKRKTVLPDLVFFPENGKSLQFCERRQIIEPCK